MILLVDDRDDSRDLLVKVLSLDGFDVQDAGTHLEALQWLQPGVVSCLVVDYQMPHVDGVALAMMVRHSSNASRTRIVLYSSYDACFRTMHWPAALM